MEAGTIEGERPAALGQYDALVARLCDSVLRSPAALDAPVREACARGDLEGPAAGLARKVRDASHAVVDADYAALKAAGFTEEQLYDLTVSAAVGAAKTRLDAATAALRGGRAR